MSTPLSLEERKQHWEKFDAEYKCDIDKIAAEGDENTLDVTIESHVWSMMQRAQDPEHIAYLESDIHLFCYTVIQAAKSYPYTNIKQKEIVLHLIRAKEIGTVALKVTDPNSGQSSFVPATTSTGARVPQDLPFLVEDIEKEWIEHSETMSTAHRTNLIAFIGRLFSVGISDRLSLCALRLFHDALETSRRLRASDPGHEVPVMELLPAIDAWFKVHYYKTYTMVRRAVDFDTPLAVPGDLARSAGVEKSGFSVERWLFWKSRVREIATLMNVGERRQLNMAHILERLGDDSVKVFVDG